MSDEYERPPLLIVTYPWSEDDDLDSESDIDQEKDNDPTSMSSVWSEREKDSGIQTQTCSPRPSLLWADDQDDQSSSLPAKRAKHCALESEVVVPSTWTNKPPSSSRDDQNSMETEREVLESTQTESQQLQNLPPTGKMPRKYALDSALVPSPIRGLLEQARCFFTKRHNIRRCGTAITDGTWKKVQERIFCKLLCFSLFD